MRLLLILAFALCFVGCGGGVSVEQVTHSELKDRWNIDPLQHLRYQSEDDEYYYIDQQTAKGVRSLRIAKTELTLPASIAAGDVLQLDDLQP